MPLACVYRRGGLHGRPFSLEKQKTPDSRRCTEFILCWHYLFSRSVSRQVSSAQVSLTSVFGMGTGGPSPQSTPTYFSLEKKSKQKKLQSVFFSLPFFSTVSNYILFCRLCQELSIKVLFAYFLFQEKVGDPYRIRTDVNGVRGRCLNHLTNGPLVRLHGFEPGTH